MLKRISISLLVILVVESYSKSLPNYIKKCPKGVDFEKCAVKVANEIRPLLVKGDRRYNIPKLNPLKIDLLQIDQGPTLNLNITEINAFGIDKYEVKSVKIDEANKKFSLDLFIPVLNIKGVYKVIGKILILPIEGSGNGQLIFNGENYHYKVDLKFVEKNGKKIIRFGKDDLTMNFQNMEFKLDNLFNGNNRLSTEMHKLLNENWKDVLNEFGPLVKKPMKALSRSVVSGYLSHLFLSDAYSS